MKKLILLLSTLIFSLCFLSCAPNYSSEVISYEYFNVATIVTLNKSQKTKISYSKAIDGCKEILENLHNLLNTKNENSDVYKFNNLKAGESIEISDITKEILLLSSNYYELTNGAFNHLIYPISDAWGFTPEKYNQTSFSIPNNLEELKPLININNYTLKDNILTKNNYDNVKIDFGGILKGYAIDLLAKFLNENGFTNGYVNIGKSSIYLGSYGKESWDLSITNPIDKNSVLLTYKAKNVHLSTSGVYERYYELNDKKYSHIISPFTLSPIDNGILSITLVGNDATYLDVLTTALMIKGLDGAINFYKENVSDCDIFIAYQNQNVYELYTNLDTNSLSFLNEKFIYKKI